jgi:hypothetical protein
MEEKREGILPSTFSISERKDEVTAFGEKIL